MVSRFGCDGGIVLRLELDLSLEKVSHVLDTALPAVVPLAARVLIT